MHTLFTLEDRYGITIDETDGEVCLKVDVRKNKDAAQLHEMLCAWRQAAAMLKGYMTIAGRVNRKFFMEKFCYGGVAGKE